MELALFVYFAGVVEGIKALFVFSSVVSLMVFSGYTIISLVESKRLQHKLYVLVPVILGFIAAVIPTEKTMYMMLAGYTGQQVLQSETASKIHKLVDAKLDEYLEEMVAKKEK